MAHVKGVCRQTAELLAFVEVVLAVGVTVAGDTRRYAHVRPTAQITRPTRYRHYKQRRRQRQAHVHTGLAIQRRHIETTTTRSPAVARMADRTASVVKRTPTITPMGHNLAKTGTSPLNRPIMRQNEAYQAIFCTFKTTSGFIFLLPVV